MDLTDALTWWPVALAAGATGGVLLALARCAVAEAVVCLAAWLYGSTPESQGAKREEWLRIIQDMAPQERPAHAGSLLWLGVKKAPARARGRWQWRRGFADGATAVATVVFATVNSNFPSKWRIRWWTFAALVMPSRQGTLHRAIDRQLEKVDDEDTRLQVIARIDRCADSARKIFMWVEDREGREAALRKLVVVLSRPDLRLPPPTVDRP